MSNWTTVRLGEVCEETRERVSVGEIAVGQYITTDNMLKDCGGVREAESLPAGGSLVAYKRGDVLVSNIRPYLKKAWLADRDGGASSDVIVFRIRDKDSLSPEYLYRALSQDAFFDHAMANATGTKMPRGKRDWIKRFEFPLPPLSIQREIVARVERDLAAADSVAGLARRLADEAETEFKATLAEEFAALAPGLLSPRGVSEFGRNEDEKTPKLQNSQQRKQQQSRETRNYPTARLGDVCEKIGSGSTPLGGKKTYIDEGVSLIRSQNVLDLAFTKTGLAHINDTQARRLDGVSVCKNDILLNITGDSVARCCIVDVDVLPARVNQHVAIIRLMDGKALPQFVNLALVAAKSALLTEASKGSTRKSLTKDFLKRFEIPLPPLAVQREIAARLDAAAGRRDSVAGLARRCAAEAALWRKAILKEAFQ